MDESLYPGNWRYSRWDGSQEISSTDPEALMDDLSEAMINDGDLRDALERLLRSGQRTPDGAQQPGLRDLIERLRQQRRQTLERYDLNSAVEDIRQQLTDIVRTERAGIQRRLDEASKPADGVKPDPALRKLLQRMAQQHTERLDALPPDLGGQVRALSDYDFMDPEARQRFQDLLKALQQQVLGNQFEGLKQMMESLRPEDLQGMREMVRDLNQMLEQRAAGGQPDFGSFMQKHGQYFPPGIETLDQLLDHLQQRAARMQAMLNSLSPENRKQLQDLADSLFRDDRLKWDLFQLAANIQRLRPGDERSERFRFKGDDDLGLDAALDVMGQLQEIDSLERELRQAHDPDSLANIDPERVRRLLGDEAAGQLEQLRQLAKMLEDAGYLTRSGDHYELTAKGVRRIGQKALRDIFSKLKKDAFGRHETDQRGTAGERSDEDKRYEFGDPFHLHLEPTIREAVVRRGPGLPVALSPEDFTVYRTEHMTESSTVLMIDMSRSMLYRGLFSAAKKVALALDSLIRSQYPSDNFYVVLFSEYARQIKSEEIVGLYWDEHTVGTNLQHALMLARQLLGRHKTGNRQVIVITDGEPTAHMEEGGIAEFNYPPTARTMVETLREVKRCSRDRIVINTFMLDNERGLVEFVNHLTKLNKGRAFFATPEQLGEYVLVDYVASKRKRIA